MAKSKTSRRLYLIGIDAAPLWLIEELSRKGGMDAFSRLLKERRISDLESTMPPMTNTQVQT